MSSSLSIRAAVAPLLASRALFAQTHRPASQLVLSKFSKLSQQQRTFIQLPFLKSAPVTPAPTQKDETAVVAQDNSFSDIVQRYGGWYPLVGLAAVALVSKEVIVLNEEFLLVSNFAAMFGTLYLTAGDVIAKGHEENREVIRKRLDGASDWNIEQLETVIKANQLNIEQVTVLKALKNEYNTLATQLVSAKHLKLRHAARDAVVKRLQEVRAREAAERDSMTQQLLDNASIYVRSVVANLPAATKAQLVDNAIAQLEDKEITADPVKQIYVTFFDSENPPAVPTFTATSVPQTPVAAPVAPAASTPAPAAPVAPAAAAPKVAPTPKAAAPAGKKTPSK